MNFKKLLVLPVMASVMLLGGCGAKEETASAPEVPAANVNTSAVVRPVLVDHQGAAFGREVPGWVEYVGMGENSKLAGLYPDREVFPIHQRGENLDALKFWLNNVDASTEIARMLDTDVKNRTAAITSADQATVQRAADQITAIQNKAKFAGLRKENDYWTQTKNSEGEVFFNYYVVYTMDKKVWQETLKRFLGELAPEAKEIITPVYDRVMEEGLFDDM